MITNRQAKAIQTLRSWGFYPGDQVILDDLFCSQRNPIERKEILSEIKVLIRASVIQRDPQAMVIPNAYRLPENLFDQYQEWYRAKGWRLS